MFPFLFLFLLNKEGDDSAEVFDKTVVYYIAILIVTLFSSVFICFFFPHVSPILSGGILAVLFFIATLIW